jgi:hypothetical protein
VIALALLGLAGSGDGEALSYKNREGFGRGRGRHNLIKIGHHSFVALSEKLITKFSIVAR